MSADVIYGTIYCITNKVNNKQYVGQTIRSPKKRFSEHFCDANRNKCSSKFGNALRKYGKDNFTMEVLEEGIDSIHTLNTLEEEYIKTLSTIDKGYNLSSGGLNHIVSDSTRKLLRAKRHSEESKEKIRKAMLGNEHSNPEIFRKMNKAKIDTTVHCFQHSSYGKVSANCALLSKCFGVNNSAVHNVVKGTYKSTKGWTLV